MTISAIVPVYNTEKLVGRCIESVLEQSFPNWELILVDDGSNDSSLEVLRKYEAKDNRIKVIHQDNEGPGLARNRGIREANGDYIVFIDSDDVIKPDYFEKLSCETADVVFIDINQVDVNYRILHKEYMSNYRALSKDDLLRNQMTGKIMWGGVRKAVKRELLLANGILFTEHKIGEEAIYSFLLIYFAKSISFIQGAVYEYVNRPGSQSDRKDDDPWGAVAVALKAKVQQMELYENYADTINAFFATATIVSLDRLAQKYDVRCYSELAEKCIDFYKKNLDENYPIDTSHMPLKVRFIYPALKWKKKMLLFFISKVYRIVNK